MRKTVAKRLDLPMIKQLSKNIELKTEPRFVLSSKSRPIHNIPYCFTELNSKHDHFQLPSINRSFFCPSPYPSPVSTPPSRFENLLWTLSTPDKGT